jgi:hypothetical protein
MELSLMERAGIIRELKRQVEFELIPKQHRSDGKTERKVVYRADFTYWRGKQFVVEDVKSPATKRRNTFSSANCYFTDTDIRFLSIDNSVINSYNTTVHCGRPPHQPGTEEIRHEKSWRLSYKKGQRHRELIGEAVQSQNGLIFL